MKFILLLSLAVVCNGFVGNEANWFGKNSLYPFIVGGDPASKNEFPFLVSLTTPACGEDCPPGLCGGSILNKRTIISAAHCFVEITPKELTVRYGSIDLHKGGKTVKVDRIISHPMYDPEATDYDIALLIVKTDIELNNSSVKTIKLPEKDFNYTTGTDVEAAGFGATMDGGERVDHLRKVVLQIKDQAKCVEQYGESRVTERQICAAGHEKDTCEGDSGGPLTIKGTNKLIGIVSFGLRCAHRRLYAVYTRVTKFLKFIQDNKAK